MVSISSHRASVVFIVNCRENIEITGQVSLMTLLSKILSVFSIWFSSEFLEYCLCV